MFLLEFSMFTVSSICSSQISSPTLQNMSMTSLLDSIEDAKLSPAKKSIAKEGNGAISTKGATVAINYVGKLCESQTSWSVKDVAECCSNINREIVRRPLRFYPDISDDRFVAEELGVWNKIQCKKVAMAAKRLRKQMAEFPDGLRFDSIGGGNLMNLF